MLWCKGFKTKYFIMFLFNSIASVRLKDKRLAMYV